MENKIKNIEQEIREIKKQNLFIIQLLSNIQTSLNKKKRKLKKEVDIIGENNDD